MRNRLLKITLTTLIASVFVIACDFDKYSIKSDKTSEEEESIEPADSGSMQRFDGSITGNGTTHWSVDGNLVVIDSSDECGPDQIRCGVDCVPDDEKNCGVCGHDCTALPHVKGSILCSDDGECLVTDESCEPGWAHCTSLADNGCETDITQAINCGGCGNDCSTGSAKLCAPIKAESNEYPTYECTSTCPEHAPTLCGESSCSDTNTSINHCGGCDKPCPRVENGESVCIEGECGFECDSGYHQCDDACLSNTSPDSCGDSCEPCEAPPNTDPICDGGECSYKCKEGFLSCDGACLANDAKNCGSCDHDCTDLPNVIGSVDCDDGRCIVPTQSCAANYAHCTNDPDDGCETDLSSPATCGSCDGRCPDIAPVCSLAAGSTTEQPIYECATGCNANAPDLCSGSCVNVLTSATNCGGCGRVCPSVTNGQPVCVDGKCGITCNNGYHQCDNSCLDNISPDSCGSRCSPCPAGSNARATCNNGACGFECVSTSYLECNDASCVPNNNDNCGTCGNSCADGQRCVQNNCVCDEYSCPFGCCNDAEQCVSPSTTACGAEGSPCRSCLSGQRCASGQCICDRIVCPDGCCDDNNQCQSRSAATCGTRGSRCTRCNLSNEDCNSSGNCECDSEHKECDGACIPEDDCCTNNDCPTNHVCESGICVCISQCSGNECGPDGCGGSCGDCRTGQRCSVGQCVCDSVSCSGGCCDNSDRCRTSSDSYCGIRGNDCEDCAISREVCVAGECINPDIDGDGIPNGQDNCPNDYNPTQHDLDGDGQGYACDSNDEVVERGTFRDFYENDFIYVNETVGANDGGLPVWWTRRNGTTAWFYGNVNFGVQVAATTYTSISAITNADSLAYDPDAAYISVGNVVVFRNSPAGTYFAARLESLVDNGSDDWTCTLTWLYAGHSANFSRL